MNILEIKEQLLTPAEVATRLGVTPETVRHWIATRKIHAMRVGGRWKIPASKLNFSEMSVANQSEEDARQTRRAAEIASARDKVEEMLG